MKVLISSMTLAFILVTRGAYAAPDVTSPFPKALDWTDSALLSTYNVNALSVVVVPYSKSSLEAGDETLREKYARADWSRWNAYKPELAGDALAIEYYPNLLKKLRERTSDNTALLIKQLNAGEPLSKSIQAGRWTIVLCIREPFAMIYHLFTGKDYPVVKTAVTCLLITPDGRIAATSDYDHTESLPIVGAMEKGFDSAQPFSERVSFRYLQKDLVEVSMNGVASFLKDFFLKQLGATTAAGGK